MSDEPRYPVETLDPNYDDGVMPRNVDTLAEAVIGHRIVSVTKENVESNVSWRDADWATVITLDNGRRVELFDTSDCCAYTDLEAFLLHPEAIDHIILGIGTTEEYTTWHIYADFGDVMEMKVGWSCGNPFYYGYGFDIRIKEIN